MSYREGDACKLPLDTWFHINLDALWDRTHLYRYMWLRKHILPPPCRILDVGTGNGNVLCWTIGDFVNTGCEPILPVEGHELVGVDIREKHREDWRAWLPGSNFWTMDVSSQPWPFSNNYFDNVVMAEVMEHMEECDWPHVLSEAWRVCAGQVLTTLPMDLWEGGIGDTLRYLNRGSTVDDHKFRPNPADLKDLVDKYMPGHVLLEIRPIYHYLATEENKKKYVADPQSQTDMGFIYVRVIKKKWWASE
jgi:SAM-dependent methyltransferase